MRHKSADSLPPDAEIYFDGMEGEGPEQCQLFAVLYSGEHYRIVLTGECYEGFAMWLAPRMEADPCESPAAWTWDTPKPCDMQG